MNVTEASRKITAATIQLSVADVSKHFGGVVAVDGVSIDVPKGRILSIIGPNGAGKTSLLNMISGFYKPDTGRIVLEGRDITRKPPSQIAALGVARTFQNIALFKGMTVLDNLMLGRHVRMRSGVLRCVLYWGLAQREQKSECCTSSTGTCRPAGFAGRGDACPRSACVRRAPRTPTGRRRLIPRENRGVGAVAYELRGEACDLVEGEVHGLFSSKRGAKTAKTG